MKNIVLAAAIALAALPTQAAEVIPGPISADVVSVYDGDTFTAVAHIWPEFAVTTDIRPTGVDTPEIRGKCQAEKDGAVLARDRARMLLAAGVRLRDVHHGKYAGRVVARVELPDGRDLAAVLIGEGLGRAYDGGKRRSWCD